MNAAELAARYRIADGTGFRLATCDPGDTCGIDMEKDEAKQLLSDNLDRMRKLQERLYAEDKWSVLIILQAMDAGGKDSAIEHVMSGINPQGCDVHSFKAPGPVELQHNFLWRHQRVVPSRGRIGIFNRSHYEEVLVVRVHPQFLKAQGLPEELIGGDIWQRRYEDIRSFERQLANTGTVVLKFFLHMSKSEQAKRFLDRIDEADKNWKFSASDIAERAYWDDYMAAYEDAVRNTATAFAPWHVVPSDNKWFSRLVISAALVTALERIDPKFPTVTEDQKRAMAEARQTLSRTLGEAD